MAMTHKSVIVTAFMIFSLPLFLAPSAEAKGGFNVVKIIDHQGKYRLEIVENDILPYLKKEIEAEYKAAKKDWSKAREAWKAQNGKKVPFACPAPVKPVFKVVAKKLPDKNEANVKKDALEGKGTYVIIQVVRGNSKKEPEILLKDEIDMKKFELAMKHYEVMQEWVSEKRSFETENPSVAFEKAQPAQPKVKILKNGFKTEEKAMAQLEKYKR